MTPSTVAIVDDDECVRLALERLLRAGGLNAVTYPSAEAFLADSESGRAACLLVDLQLGGMSGLELQRDLVARGAQTPLIFMTARDDLATHERLRQAGACACLGKPVRGRSLLEAVRRAIAEADADSG